MIEDIILEQDKRGMRELREALPLNFCERAAEFVYDHLGTVIIVTGFYVSGFCETDGPVGSIILGEALLKLNSDISIITDEYCYHVLKKVKVPFDIFKFPIAGERESEKACEDLISAIDPSLLISVERCGRAADNRYYNMRGEDISLYTGKLDLLFDLFSHTVGIGDGGNEIGMGNVYDAARKAVMHGEVIASIVRTTHLIVSTVSNWGVYGLLGYLSRITGENLLKKEDTVLQKVIHAGAIDSSSKKRVLAVDGFSLQETNAVIERVMPDPSINPRI